MCSGVLGLVGLFAGLGGTFIPDGSGGLFPDSPQAQSSAMYGVATVILATATSGVGIFFIARHFGTLPFVGKLVLADGVAKDDDDRTDAELSVAAPAAVSGARAGAVGEAVTPLRPAGAIEVDGDVVDAVSDSGFFESGTRVTLLERRGFSWLVEPASDGDTV